MLAFGVATLNILGLLGPTIVWLDQLGFRLGDTHISALDMLRATVELALLLWLAVLVSRLLEAAGGARPEPDPVAPRPDQQAHPLLARSPSLSSSR